MKRTLKGPLLDRCSNMFGPIRADVRKRIMRHLDKPTAKTWNDVFTIVIKPPVTTLWKAVIDVDPSFQTEAKCETKAGCKWKKVPDAVTVARAICRATRKS